MRGNRLLMGLVGVCLLATGTVQAVSISNPPAVHPGGATVAMGDFGISGFGYFDLWLSIPDKIRLLSIFDDPDYGSTTALYQRNRPFQTAIAPTWII